VDIFTIFKKKRMKALLTLNLNELTGK